MITPVDIMGLSVPTLPHTILKTLVNLDFLYSKVGIVSAALIWMRTKCPNVCQSTPEV